MIVLDASATVEMLLRTRTGQVVLAHLGDGSLTHFPELMPIETVFVLRRLSARGFVPESRAADAVRDLAGLTGQRHRHDLLLGDVFRLSTRLTAYDAVYVALAHLLGATLLTLDRRLASQAAAVVDVLVPE